MEKQRQMGADDSARPIWSSQPAPPKTNGFRGGLQQKQPSKEVGERNCINYSSQQHNSSATSPQHFAGASSIGVSVSSMKERLAAQARRRDLSQREPTLAGARWPRAEQAITPPSNNKSNHFAASPAIITGGDYWTTTTDTTPTTPWSLSHQQRQQQQRHQQFYQQSPISPPQSPPASANHHQAKPRLPRGVSKIPRQVHANSNGSSNSSPSNTAANAIESHHHYYQSTESETRGADYSGGSCDEEDSVEVDNDNNDYNNSSSNHQSSFNATRQQGEGVCSAAARYLTFSRDQASSHFKSLQEELSSIGSSNRVEAGFDGQQQQIKSSKPATTHYLRREHSELAVEAAIESSKAASEAVAATTADSVGPKPAERQRIKLLLANKQQQPLSRQQLQASSESIEEEEEEEEVEGQVQTITLKTTTSSVSNNGDQLDHALAASGNIRHQQPICEAFIMTGQSMLRLSCDESENNINSNNNHINQQQSHTINCTNSASQLQKQNSEQALLKSHSWNKLTTSATTISTSGGDNGTHNGNNRQATVHQQHQSNEDIARHRAPQEAPLSSVGSNIGCEQKTVQALPKGGSAEMMAIKVSSSNTVPLVVSAPDVSERIPTRPQPRSPTDTRSSADLSPKAEPRLNKPQQQQSLSPPIHPHLQPSDEQQQADTSLSPAPACNDRDSARRLAKRLYNLSGFKRSDVCHHLAKNNPFSKMVAEEYLNLFDFRGTKLDAALRKFLSKLQLNGETQERERLLEHFSQRYYDCNKEKFPTAATVQTLVCALILLNTDLHCGGRTRRPKLGLGVFIDGLNHSMASNHAAAAANPSGQAIAAAAGANGLASNAQLPRHLLVDLYESIKRRPLKCSGEDKCDMSSFEAELDKMYSQQAGGSGRSNTLPTRRFALGSNAPSSTLSASARRHLKQGLGKLNGASGSLGALESNGNESTIEFRSGFLSRKRVFEPNGKPTSRGKRGWRRVRATLHDLRLVLKPTTSQEEVVATTEADKKQAKAEQTSADADKEEQTAKQQEAKSKFQNIAQDMRNTIKIHHTFAKRSTNYKKREFVFQLKLADQSEFLVQANSEQDMATWIDTINFAAACLSSPALPSAITNGNGCKHRQQRPLLQAAYTRLSYWEQLIDHEERLQRLKVELDEHLSQAPDTKKANKRAQAEFIERIAYLKADIERYGTYVDLMRKKSNSPEAIILSKHPQIASLTPSDEMVLSLPSFAPPDSVAAAKAASASTSTTNTTTTSTKTTSTTSNNSSITTTSTSKASTGEIAAS